MGFLKTSSRRSRPRSSFPPRLFMSRVSPAPPQIITSTPLSANNSAVADGKSYDDLDPLRVHSSSHVAIQVPEDRPPTEGAVHESVEELSRPPGESSHQAGQRAQEHIHLLGVQGQTSLEERMRRARRASHSDIPSSQISGSLAVGAEITRVTSPVHSLRSGVPPSSFKDLAVLYQVVAERRTAFDNLLWQVPATSLTAHAFLFSISLAADTGRFARIASMGLCIVITVLTLHLFTRQLQAEDADHRWLADFEERHQIDYYDRAHGDRWKDYRAQKPAGAGKLGWLAMHRSYPLWSKGMLIIGFLAVAILILAIFDQKALMGYNCQLP